MKTNNNVLYPNTINIFLNSSTFNAWQKYCHYRDKFSKTTSSTLKSYFHKPSQNNISKNILPSWTYKTWLKAYNIKIYLYEKILFPNIHVIKKYIPQSIKNNLKHLYSAIIQTSDKIDQSIKHEWASWDITRSNSSVDIINFGVISYDYRFQRPQQLATVLGKNNRVFYIETEFLYSSNAKSAKIHVRKASKNVYIVTLSAPVNYFIYRDTPSSKGSDILFASIKKLMRQARIINPVAKIDHPFWDILRARLSMHTIYDVMDLHEGFKESGKTITIKHQDLVKNADLVLASSDYLNKTLQGKNSNILILRNAGDYNHFVCAATAVKSRPVELRQLSGHIMGYYGALAEWLDVDLISEVAQQYPNDSIVLIGRVQNSKLEALSKQYPNIYLLGEKPYKDLPNYLSCFDVCLIPFKINELIKATNPVKIYEYFASGKPVVSSNIPELKIYEKLIYFGANPEEFSLAIRKALQEKSQVLRASRQKVSKMNTWEIRAETLQKRMLSNFYPKVSVVILVYNQSDLSKISIDSTLNRSKYPNLELLVVDNKSDAKTLEMLKSYEGIKNIKVIYNPENFGFAKGNNVGMKLANGEYLILLNNDVRVTPGWVERLVFHAKDKSIGLVGPVTNSIGNESKIDILYNPKNMQEIESKSADYVYDHWGETIKLRNIAAFAWICSRAVYSKIGGLDERFGKGMFEDDDYCVRIGKEKLEILCADDAFVHHYGGASTNWGSPEFQLLFNTNKAKFESKWDTKWIPHQYRKK